MFADVEKEIKRGPVIIGIGTEEQGGALRVAGADKVFSLDDLEFFLKHPGHLVRDGDTLLMVQPNLINKSDMRVILSASGSEGKGGILVQVAGHKAMNCQTDAQLSAFRHLKPQDAAIPMANKLGRPSRIEYTPQQADAIIREWHRVPKNMPPVVTSIAENILGVDAGTLGKTWVRDLVIKFVGTAQRAKPDHWQGISTETNKETSGG